MIGNNPQSLCWPGFLPLGNGIGKSVNIENKNITGQNFEYHGESEWQQKIRVSGSSSLTALDESNI